MKAKGARSTRWAFMGKLVLSNNGRVYLDRLRLVQTPWFGIYRHYIRSPDPGVWLHDHPWSFGSLVLRGGYTEDYTPFPNVHLDLYREHRTWRRFSFHRMEKWSAHTIIAVEPRTVMLVVVGRRSRTWGFFTDRGWLPWDVYEKEAQVADKIKGVPPGTSVEDTRISTPIPHLENETVLEDDDEPDSSSSA